MSDAATEANAAANGPASAGGDKDKAKSASKQQKNAAKEARKAQADQQKQIAASKKDKEKKEIKVITYDKETNPGDKKDVSGGLAEMPEQYSPRYVQAAWYAWWEAKGFFKPEYGRRSVDEENPNGKFMMVIPPPNVTGSLHLGHALTFAVEDAITRYNRMQGKTTLWNPGCDHAGIATQVVVEKKIWRENKLTRHDLGRDKFIEKVWEWKEEKGGRIYEQLRLMGASVDWDRATFTMEPKMSRAVMAAFIKLHEQGLIYRSNRLVNWSCTLRSAISDIEVDKMELAGKKYLPVPGYEKPILFGVLLSFAYPVDGSNEEIVVATTRIETMLGDTAVAVHPSDERYTHLHGKRVKHPFLDKTLPIVLDEFVDKEFGTGAVKITPAHDPNDYEVGKRHNLPFLNMLTDDGDIAEGFGEFSGMKRFDARRLVKEKLEAMNLFRGMTDNPMVVPVCQRSKDIVEPLIKTQWYVNCSDMARRAVDAVKNKDLRFVPDMYERTWFHWLENIKDWCISRQLWWGHRIPAYRVITKDQIPTSAEEKWVSANSEEEAAQKASAKFNLPAGSFTLAQDEDVLDTWFSSGLFPFAIFGWPDQTTDLKTFYPGTLLETGNDIIFFWVARMVMLGLTLMDDLPFRDVFLHSIIRDAHGRKMSKSIGNVIDPTDVIYGISLEGLNKMLLDSNLDPKELEKAKDGQKADFPQGIPECGVDALRFTLCNYASQGRDINMDIKRVEGYRHFCNKLWNALRFTLMSLGEGFTPLPQKFATPDNASHMDRWILSCFAAAIETVNNGFTAYDFPTATGVCYQVWLYQYCDVYIEYAKEIINSSSSEPAKIEATRQTLYTAAEIGLRLLHPFMPFITEELWQRLPARPSDSWPESISVASFPTSQDVGQWRDVTLENDVNFNQNIIRQLRATRAEYNIHPKTQIEVYLKCDTQTTTNRINPFLSTIMAFINASKVDLLDGTSAGDIPTGCAIVPVSGECEAYINLKGSIDIDKELTRMKTKLSKSEGPLDKLVKASQAGDYEQKVPQTVRAANEEKMEQMRAEIEKIRKAIETLELMSQT